MTGIISIEPDQGDFVGYIEALVGPPPEDPETAARLISEQLAQRSRDNVEIMNAASRGADAAQQAVAARTSAPLGTGWGHSAHTQPASNPLDPRSATGTAMGGMPATPGAGGTVPGSVADAMRQTSQGLGRQLMAGLSRLMIFAGIGIIGAAIVLADQFPWLTPVPGIVIAFLGVMLGNMAGSRRQRR